MAKKIKTPLSGFFTAVSLIGLIISLFFTVFGRFEPKIGFLLIFIFTIFIIASLVSIYPSDDEYLE